MITQEVVGEVKAFIKEKDLALDYFVEEFMAYLSMGGNKFNVNLMRSYLLTELAEEK